MIEYIKDFKCCHVHIRTVMMDKMIINFKRKMANRFIPRNRELFLGSINQMGTMKYWEHQKWNIATDKAKISK